MKIMLTKAECRKLFSEKREQLSPSAVAVASEKIADLLFSSFDLREKTMSMFLPIERKIELNTYLILEKVLLLGGQICLPKADFQHKELVHYLYESSAQLVTSAYGIREPAFGEIIPADAIDIVIVPLLAFDLKGYRVGYGMGFYDRFLAHCKPTTVFIGLSAFEPIARIKDRNDMDLPLHFCVTPEKVYSF